MLLTYRYRVKSLNGKLNDWACAVNFVWNFCNDTQKHALRWSKKWPSNFDIDALMVGSSKLLGLHSGILNAISAQYVKSRKQHKRPYLRYRGKRTLGWMPFKGRDLHRDGNAFRFAGNTFRVFDSRPLPAGKIKDGSSFAQDARGRWYLNIVIEVAEQPQRSMKRGVGIDLGLKDILVTSDAEKIGNPRHYRRNEEKLAIAQRAGKKRQVKKIHAKIVNTRRDHHHQLTTRLVQEYDYIAVGNVSRSGLAKTRMAATQTQKASSLAAVGPKGPKVSRRLMKSVHEVSWSSIRGMLRYKSIAKGVWYEEVDERYTTQTCSHCGALPDERPKGIAGLGIRQWTCGECGTVHDRDVNAARNILMRHPARSGHRTPVEGISCLQA